MSRGEEVRRPSGWVLIAMSKKVADGWTELSQQAPSSLDEAWVAITGAPRRVTERQHRLRGALATHHLGGVDLEVWQYEVTGGGRVWYLIDDASKTLWLHTASCGHPKSTERRRHGR